MKPIIMNMREMSLSREVYESRPNIFFSVFIYGLFAMIGIALLWSYFGEIDIVVRASGTIRPNTQMATVTNAAAGEVQAVFFYDGQEVRQDDILYIINSVQPESDQRAYEERIGILNHELAALRLYRESIEAGKNLVLNYNEEYSARFESYLVNLNALSHKFINDDNLLELEIMQLEETLAKTEYELAMYKSYCNILKEGL